MDRIDSKHHLAALARRAFPGYRGRKFRVVISDRPRRLLSFWDGGSRDIYMVVQNNSVFAPPTIAPFGRESAPDYAPVPGAVLVEHSIFMGKDVGCTIYLHPEDPRLAANG
jgi:hypothetical protein